MTILRGSRKPKADPAPDENGGGSRWYGPRLPMISLLALAGLGMIVRIEQLRSAIFAPHEFRQTQTMFAVRDYHEHGIDLFRSYLPVFGDQQNVPFELPLFQAVASLPSLLGLDVLLGARLVALASFEASAMILAWLLFRWVGPRAAVLAMALFQFLPFGLLWGVAPLIDFFSVTLGLATVAMVDLHTRSGKVATLAAGVFLCWLTMLVKVTTFPAIGVLVLVAAYYAALTVPRALVVRRLGAFLAMGPGAGVVWLLWWTHHADGVKAGHPSSAWLTSAALTDWNFGTTEQRQVLFNYQVVLARISQEVVGPGLLGVALCLVLAFVLRRHRVLVVGLCLAGMSPVLVFFNLYVIHNYYLIAVFPVAVALAAVGIDLITGTVARQSWAWVLAGGLAVGLGLLTWATPGGQADVASIDPTVVPNAIAGELREVTGPTDDILVVNCDWDPTILYLARREGLMITGHEPGVDWQAIVDQGYRYLMACDANPGATVPAQLILRPTSQPHVFTVEGWQS